MRLTIVHLAAGQLGHTSRCGALLAPGRAVHSRVYSGSDLLKVGGEHDMNYVDLIIDVIIV